MRIQHPVAAILSRAAIAQDEVTGDGSCSALAVIGEIMRLAEPLINECIHPRKISAGLDIAREWTLDYIDKSAITLDIKIEKKDLLLNIIKGVIATKIEPFLVEQMSEAIYNSIYCIRPRTETAKDPSSLIPLDLFMIEIMPINIGIKPEVNFIKGMVMDHGCRHPDMPHELFNCYIFCCNVNLEYERTEVNSSFLYSNAKQREQLSRSERLFIDNKVRKIIELKNKVCTKKNQKNFVVLNQKGIDPSSLELLAKEGIIALRRVKRRNMERITLCCGGSPVNSVEDLDVSVLGFARKCWEVNYEDQKYTFVEVDGDPRSCCITIQAPFKYQLERCKDAIRDGLRACRNALIDKKLLPGAGAFEIAASEHLRSRLKKENNPKTITGIALFADALLTIPRSLAKNSGLSPNEALTAAQLAYRQAIENDNGLDNKYFGINLDSIEPINPIDEGIWDSVTVKKQLVSLSTTLSSLLLIIDEIIRAGKIVKNDKLQQ
ncbi:uncharacterized protein LOC142598016 [Dermatophagoides farinae]|uniref:uncharacterized protein LOC142598016 n=1 Tax=Dermatophagoides farinae TaxID=6954 RepID=UPI003F641C93